MKLIEALPVNPQVAKYIDRYQYFELSEPAFLKTIPNGKFDCWTAIDGCFEIWDFKREKFVETGDAGILPATNRISLIQIVSHLTCLNIKLNLSVVGLGIMEYYAHHIAKQNITSFLSKSTQRKIVGKEFLHGDALEVSKLDELMSSYFTGQKESQEPYHLLTLLTSNTLVNVNDLANKMNMTAKSLERLTKKKLGLTPIELFNIFRFEKTTAYLQKSETLRLIEALDFGYYDQSHFVKTCRKITGIPPRQLLNKMKLPTNDLFVD